MMNHQHRPVMELNSSLVLPSSRVLLNEGVWSEAEDLLLTRYIEEYGPGNWGQIPLRAGLNRCPNSCRLRWFNNLQPNVKREEFEPDEVDLIIRMHKLLGNRWSLIAGRFPGRTPYDIKNYYKTHLLKEKSYSKNTLPCPNIKTMEINNHLMTTTKVFRPVPRKISEKKTEAKDHASMSSSSTTKNNNLLLGFENTTSLHVEEEMELQEIGSSADNFTDSDADQGGEEHAMVRDSGNCWKNDELCGMFKGKSKMDS